MAKIKGAIMLITENIKVQMSPTEAKKCKLYDLKKYKEGKLELPVKRSSGKGWRLIHDGEKVLDIVEGTAQSVTSTIQHIEEFKTKKAMNSRIKALKLEALPDRDGLIDVTPIKEMTG